MNRLFLSVFLLFSLHVFVFSQSTDSMQIQKDSVVRITPIPEIGSIEPFGKKHNIISDKEIIFREYRSLYDILSSENGFFIRDLASPGQQNQININGFDEKNIAIFVDGIPYNDHYTASFNLWDIPVEAIERIEIISSASAIFYDGKSAGSTINIMTKNYNNNRAITQLRYSQGVSGYTQTDAMFAQNIFSGFNLSLGISHHGFGSNKEYPQKYRGRFINSNDDSWNFRSKIRYNFSNWANTIFSYSYHRRWTGLHGGVDFSNTASVFDGLLATVKNEEAYEKVFNHHYNLTTAIYPFQDSSFLATFSFYAFERLREYRDEENRSLTRNSIFTIRDFASSAKGLKVNILSQYSDIRFIGYADLQRIQTNDVITVGLKSDILPQSFFVVSPFVTFKDLQSQFIANAGVEATLHVTSSFNVYGGITQNIINDVPSTVGPLTSPMNADFFLYTQREKETFSILELGSRFVLPKLFSAEISYKKIEQSNPIIFDTILVVNSSAYYYPAKISFDAISASAHYQWNEFHLEGAANYLHKPKFIRDNVVLTSYPDLTLNGSIYFQGKLANGSLDLKIGFRGNYYSEQTGMRPYDEYGVWIPSAELRYGPTGTMDFFAIGKIGDAFVHLIWENISGNQYLLAPVYPMYDRNIRFGVTWEFLD